MSTDSKFFTNDKNNTLLDRLKDIFEYTEKFDCLVGYFYVNGFYKLQDALEDVDEIRIIVGMGVDKKTFELIDEANEFVSDAELKESVNNNLVNDLNISDNTQEIEDSVKRFISWIQSGKLKVKAYKKRSIHSKVYIMTSRVKAIDGHVITGSSNLTAPGLSGNLEFNVELKDSPDYYEALNIFEKLWEESEDVSEDYVNTITNKTWLNDNITPYELYLKFLYEYYGERIDTDITELDDHYHPPDFKQLQYQTDAVIQAKNIIKEHGGVIIADVVGLGKTIMGALLLQQLKGNTLVIAPPQLTDSNNPGGWDKVLREFQVTPFPYIESKGRLEQITKEYDLTKFSNVLIDEAHAFRNQKTLQYEYLKKICRGKNVILLTATPFNNSPNDLLSLIKLFKNSHDSRLPHSNVHDLEVYFKDINYRLNNVDKEKDPEEYEKVSKKVTADIRQNILEHLMIRRTRNDIKKYYKKDLEKNNFEFPHVNKPIPETYEFDKNLNEIFDTSLEIIAKNLTYAKYTPLSDKYFNKPEKKYQSSQKMMANFIKILLVKRLESGVHAFRKSIENCVNTHRKVIKTFKEKGEFITSQGYNRKILELIETEDFETIEKLIDEGKAKHYKKEQFNNRFLIDLEKDLNLFEYIQKLWNDVEKYPKNEELVRLLNNELKNKKVIIFTEFIDTADFLEKKIKENCTQKVLKYTGKSNQEKHQKVIDNFDDNVRKEKQKDDYDILISTDVLSHGVNLHRSNIIINYDIPWNPTKIMQRVGRIERLGTKFKEIYIYNFFPTAPIEKEGRIEELVTEKISKFISLLGNDAPVLTEEPIKSHALFNKLNGELEDDDEPDDYLYYLTFIRNIRDNNRPLYNKIIKIPKKARVTRKGEKSLISLIRTNKYKQIIKTDETGTKELTLLEAVNELKASEDEKGIAHDEEYYEYLHRNLNYFETNLEEQKISLRGNEDTIRKYISLALTQDEQLSSYERKYLNKILLLLEKGSISEQETSKINKKLKEIQEPHMVYLIIHEVLEDDIMKIPLDEEDNDDITFDILLSEYRK